jgi:hypothetical protein
VGLSGPFGTFLAIEKSLAPAEFRIPDRPGRSSVTVQNINIMLSYNLKFYLPFFYEYVCMRIELSFTLLKLAWLKFVVLCS